MLGRRFGHYRLVRKLGAGGFATVYLGEHLHLDDIQVAVKVFHPELARDDHFLKLLRRECMVLHALAHPGIVAFRDLIIEGERAAIVMELLEGSDLYHHLVRTGPLPAAEVLRILEGVMAPLAHAHHQRVVHRDIKPGNVFLCTRGAVKIMDFGIAKATHDTRATQSGVLSGSLDYMASERFRGESLPASDLYALGLLAWELLVGRPACVEGDLPAKLGWHMKVGAPNLSGLCPDCPGWLAEFIERLTAIDADARPMDATLGLRELERAQASSAPSPQPSHEEPVRARAPATPAPAPPAPAPAPPAPPPRTGSPTPPAVQPAKPPSRLPGLLAAALLVISAAAIGVGWVLHKLIETTASRAGTDDVPSLADWDLEPPTSPPSRGDDLSSAEDLVVAPVDRTSEGYDQLMSSPGTTLARRATPKTTGVQTRTHEPNAATGQGTLTTRSNPMGAAVYLGSTMVGVTPLVSLGLPTGSQMVRIELEGFSSVSKVANIEHGEALDLGTVQLESQGPITGYVTLWADGLIGAKVYVDNQYVGQLPVKVELSQGTHSFMVHPAGSEAFTLSRDVTFDVQGIGISIDVGRR